MGGKRKFTQWKGLEGGLLTLAFRREVELQTQSWDSAVTGRHSWNAQESGEGTSADTSIQGTGRGREEHSDRLLSIITTVLKVCRELSE